jgi:hypothetical protein
VFVPERPHNRDACDKRASAAASMRPTWLTGASAAAKAADAMAAAIDRAGRAAALLPSCGVVGSEHRSARLCERARARSSAAGARGRRCEPRRPDSRCISSPSRSSSLLLLLLLMMMMMMMMRVVPSSSTRGGHKRRAPSGRPPTSAEPSSLDQLGPAAIG